MKRYIILATLGGMMLFPSLALGSEPTGPKGSPEKEPLLIEQKQARKEGKFLEIGKLMDPSLYSRRPSMLQWNRSAENPTCIYLENDTLKTYTPGKGESWLLNLQELKEDSLVCQKTENPRFPQVMAVNGNIVYLYCGHRAIAYDCHSRKVMAISSVPEKATNFDLDPSHTQLAFTKENNLFFLQQAMKFAVSRNPDTGIVVGQPVHRFEFGINKGTFWSNTGKWLAYYVMDESMVQKYPITSYLQDPTEVNNIRYPEAGEKMHSVWVGVINTETYQKHYLKPYFNPAETYVTSVTWSPDDKEILLGLLNRNQKDFTMVCYDVASGEPKHVVFEEKNDIYVEPETGPVFRPGYKDQFIWMSERKGYNHIYLYNTSGECIKAVTPEDEPWMVTSFIGFAPNGKTAYFMATKESPLQENLYSVDMRSGKMERLTKEDGVHSIEMHASGKYFIDSYTSPEMGRCTQIIDNKGRVVKVLMKTEDPMAEYVCPEYRIYQLQANDGKTPLYGRMILPQDFDPSKKYPALVYVYGGPHAQMITDSYNYGSGAFLRFLAQQGYIVWTLDNRGSSMRGFEFETATHRQLGVVEAADQMTGVAFLRSLPFVDSTRIGVDGWSFGGFMSLNLKTLYPDVFRVSTAGGPVINWEWYEVMYGERYMGTPQDNPEGYEWANLLNRVDSIRGKVMLIQGGLDPVVLPKQATTFVQKCIQKKIPVDFFLYPNHEHNVIGPQRDHLWEKLYDYYQQNLR